jgi:hypothetical protein
LEAGQGSERPIQPYVDGEKLLWIATMLIYEEFKAKTLSYKNVITKDNSF